VRAPCNITTCTDGDIATPDAVLGEDGPAGCNIILDGACILVGGRGAAELADAAAQTLERHTSDVDSTAPHEALDIVHPAV
jgi:hypothetical protein